MNTGASLNLVIFLVTTIINSTLLCLILVKQRKNLRNVMYASFVFSIFFLLLWTLFNYLADTTSDYAHALLYTRATIPSGCFTLWFIFIFSCLFPVKTKGYRTSALIYLGIILIFSVLAMTPAVITSVSISPGMGIQDINNTGLFIPIVVLFITIPFHAFWNLYKKYTRLQGIKKEQIRYTLLGWSLFLVGATVVSAILPLVVGDARLSKLGPLASICMVGLTTYAILKHHFLDIRIVIQRGLIYFLLFGITASVYIASLEFIAVLLHKITDMESIISAGLTMILGIFFIRPLEDYFKKATDALFFKDSYDYAGALHSLSKVLHTQVTETDIIAHSSELLKHIFKSTEAAFSLDGDCSIQTPSSMLAISTQIVFEGKCTGTLTIGPKRSGDKYTQRDVQLLETFAYQAAIALEKGHLYEKVERYNADLEQLVKKRTEEIQKLQEDQKQAMIDVSHNLQTPLAVIRGELELLNEFEDEIKIQTVKKSIDRVSGFIRQLLHLARLEHSMYTIELSPMDLSALIREQVEYLEVMTQEKDVKIICSSGNEVLIRGHARLLGELLINLVLNAITYRDPNRKSVITIRLLKTDTDAILTIQDNGMGIAEEDLSEVFTRFYRGKNRIREDKTPSANQENNLGHSGTGLGLAICKKIIERHNGTISAESILGEKTIFTITLPLLK